MEISAEKIVSLLGISVIAQTIFIMGLASIAIVTGLGSILQSSIVSFSSAHQQGSQLVVSQIQAILYGSGNCSSALIPGQRLDLTMASQRYSDPQGASGEVRGWPIRFSGGSGVEFSENVRFMLTDVQIEILRVLDLDSGVDDGSGGRIYRGNLYLQTGLVRRPSIAFAPNNLGPIEIRADSSGTVQTCKVLQSAAIASQVQQICVNLGGHFDPISSICSQIGQSGAGAPTGNSVGTGQSCNCFQQVRNGPACTDPPTPHGSTITTQAQIMVSGVPTVTVTNICWNGTWL